MKDVLHSFDASVPHIARVYDYWLGGKDNFAPDREVGDKTREVFPQIALGVRANRAFLARAVRFLADTGIRQFLDIGTGIPAADNTHQVAQAAAAESRIVYTDNDPIVLSHAKALLTSSAAGACDYINGDLRDTGAIVEQAKRTLDFSQPVAIMLVAILHCIPDSDNPRAIVRELMDAVVPGSYLVISHPALDQGGSSHGRMATLLDELMPIAITHRTRDDVTRFFDGTELVEPGIVAPPRWRPASEAQASSPCAMWAGVARRP